MRTLDRSPSSRLLSCWRAAPVGQRLARGLAVVCDIVDPAVIVLGGGMSNVDALYPAVEQALGPHTFTDAPVARVVKNRWGDSSGVRGAAWLWPLPSG